jgi:hypothetical protein
MAQILSYAGQTHRTQNNVVEQPAFLRSDQKPLKWWAHGGLVYCINPNKPDTKPSYMQPLDALKRVAALIKIFIADLRKTPGDYAVTEAILANFFCEFKLKVYDVACEQDAQAGGMIEKTNIAFAEAKKEMQKEQAIEAAKYADKKTKIFVSPKSVNIGTQNG